MLTNAQIQVGHLVHCGSVCVFKHLLSSGLFSEEITEFH